MPGRFRRYPLWRWFLQLDPPVPDRADGEIIAEVERHYPWNFAVNLLDVTWYWFGLSFISSTTIVPLFISKLTPHPLALGLAAMIAQGAWFLPQLFTAHFTERVPRKKAIVVRLGFVLERVPMWLLPVAALLAPISPWAALALFFLAYTWHGLGAGVIAPAWQDLIAKCFPVARRGRFLGVSLFFGAAAGTFSALLSTRLLENHPFPVNFLYVFAAAALAINTSWLFLALTREPVAPVPIHRLAQVPFLADLRTILVQDANFRRFLVARLLLVLGGMASGFVTVAALRQWAVPDSKVGIFTAELLIGQTAGNLVFGLLADRYGHKLSLELGALASCLAFVAVWLAPQAFWFDIGFVLLGVASGAVVVSGILIVLEFAPAPRRPTYAGLANTATGVVSMVGPLLAAALARWSYDGLFAVSAAFSLAAWLALARWVREPRQAVVETATAIETAGAFD
jgi:MFS family permease